MSMSVKCAREKFQIKNILTIIGDPTYQAVNEMKEVLYYNAAAILKNIGGGVMGVWDY